MHAAGSCLNANYLSSHTLRFSHVFLGLIKRAAGRRGSKSREEENDKNLRDALHAQNSNLKLKVAAQKVGENVKLFPKQECDGGRARTPVLP